MSFTKSNITTLIKVINLTNSDNPEKEEILFKIAQSLNKDIITHSNSLFIYTLIKQVKYDVLGVGCAEYDRMPPSLRGSLTKLYRKMMKALNVDNLGG